MTVKIKAPKAYHSGVGLLEECGPLIAAYGTNALLIGSPKSFSAAGPRLFPALERAGVRRTDHSFSGSVTMEAARALADAHADGGIDAVIGLGGGRVMDTAKLVGTLLNVPVITIPTIAATCAAWAAVSIHYDDAGRFQGGFFNPEGPQLVLADVGLLFAAPRRYLLAGIVDALAKWYEIVPYEPLEGESSFLQTMLLVAGQLRDTLARQTAPALELYEKGVLGIEAVQVIDAVIYLAGLTGSLQTDTLYQGFAHPFYNELSSVPSSAHLLHGEKVGFGILVQQTLEHKSSREAEETLRLFAGLGNTLTLADLGLEHDPVALGALARRLWARYAPSLNRLGYGFDPEELVRAMEQTNDRVRTSPWYRRFSAEAEQKEEAPCPSK